MLRTARIWCLILVSFLLALPAAVQAMPPHPSLKDKIARGEVKLPEFMTNPYLRAPGMPDQPTEAPVALTGTLHALAVVVKFSDHPNTVNASFFNSLLFPSPVTYPSVRDFYQKVSYGKVDIITFNAPSALGWIQAPSTYAFYVDGQHGTDGPYPNNCQKLAEDIVDYLHSKGVDFSKYIDPNRPGYTTAVMLVHSGPGAELTGSPNDIWSHSWVLHTPKTYNGVTIDRYITMPEYWHSATITTSDMGIGVFCHEMGHGFWSLPDLYDTTYYSEGIGNFSLMAGGSWGGPNRLGDAPAWPDAWCRTKMGFVTPTVVHGTVTKNIPQAANNPSVPTVFKLTSPVLGSKEYFLVENRQYVANYYDYIMDYYSYSNLTGLAIWHADDAQWDNGSDNDYACTSTTTCSCPTYHYLVALQQADGFMDLENNINRGDTGDLFPGIYTNRSWTMATNPSSGSWYTCNDTKVSLTNISNSMATMTATFQAPASPQGQSALDLLLLSN